MIGDGPFSFDKPVALRTRLKLPPARQTIAALTVGGFAAIGAALWLNSEASRHNLESQGLCSPGSAYTGRQQLHRLTRCGTHAAIYPSYRALVRPGTAGGHS